MPNTVQCGARVQFRSTVAVKEGEAVLARRYEGRDENWEGGILGSRGRDVASKWVITVDDDLFHVRTPTRRGVEDVRGFWLCRIRAERGGEGLADGAGGDA